MSKRQQQLHFNLFLHDTGHHEASWRLPESDPHADLDLGFHQRLTRIAEDAKFDSVFLADSPALWGDPARRPSARLEPTVLLAALAAGTTRIGILRERGLFRTEYEGRTLREHYGLPRPGNRFTDAPAVAELV